jgi:hypothetical protein
MGRNFTNMWTVAEWDGTSQDEWDGTDIVESDMHKEQHRGNYIF